MQKVIFTLLVILCKTAACTANDTTWLDQKWKRCGRDTATYYGRFTKKQTVWQQQLFYVKNQQLFMNGYFDDEAHRIKTGVFKWYGSNGNLTDSITYEKGVPRLIIHFHENGMKKRMLVNDKNYVTTEVNSWDAAGNEITADTFYNNRFGRDCHMDTANSKQTVNLEDSLWHYRFYNVKADTVFFDLFYKERLGKTHDRYSRYYKKGILRDSLSYINGKIMSASYFYNSGTKNAFQTFDSMGKITFAKNWDENGNETKPDTRFRYAAPEEGFKAWQRKLLKQINKDDSIDKKLRKDLYGSVFIGFFIEEDGNIRETFIKDRSPYPEMDSIILRACKTIQHWAPCVFHGRPERFFGVHSFSFIKGKVIRYKTLY